MHVFVTGRGRRKCNCRRGPLAANPGHAELPPLYAAPQEQGGERRGRGTGGERGGGGREVGCHTTSKAACLLAYFLRGVSKILYTQYILYPHTPGWALPYPCDVNMRCYFVIVFLQREVTIFLLYMYIYIAIIRRITFFFQTHVFFLLLLTLI